MAAAIDGTWKASTDTAQAPKKPDIYLLTKNVYTCKTCTPAFSVPADGNYHAVKGNPYFDAVAIRVTSNGITEMDSKGGKMVTTSDHHPVGRRQDGHHQLCGFQRLHHAGQGHVIARKVEARPGGLASHLRLAGPSSAYSGFSDNGLTVTYKTQGDTVTMTTPTGQGYAAKLGGPAAPYKGDPGTDTVR